MEAFLASLKVLTLAAFAIYGFLAITGAVNTDIPGNASFSSVSSFLPHGLKGFAGSMLLVLFSFTGTGIIGMAVADTKNPEKDLPPSIYIITAVVTSLYVLAILFIVLLLPSKSMSTSVSPFVF
jgi:GABA permease/S-methylmethionine transporter